MAIELTEKPGSPQRRVGENASTDVLYFLTGTADDAEVRTKVEDDTPLVHDGLARQTIDFEPQWVDEVNDEGYWDVVVHYGLRTPLISTSGGGGGITRVGSFSFDTSGGTQHITQSLKTVGSFGAGRNVGGIAGGGASKPQDHDGAIGYNGESVEGVDIALPVFSFSEVWRLSTAVVTDGYKGQLFFLTSKVNNASFKGFRPGELLFLGANGSLRGPDWEISYSFAGSPNRANFTVSKTIHNVTKKGWDYMWVKYKEVPDDQADRMVKRPEAAYVERVYDEADFAGLLIGT